MRFELKHDKLAVQVYELASSEAKARRKAEGIYQMYEDIGLSRLFTQEELEYLLQFQPILRPKDSLGKLILKSKVELGQARKVAEEKERALWEREKELIERAKVRQKRVWGVIGGAALVAIGLLIFAFIQNQKAVKYQKLASDNELRTKEIQLNLIDKNQLNFILKNELSKSLTAWARFDKSETFNTVTALNQYLPSAFIDPRDWNVYETLELNGQTWMAKNLNYHVPGKSWFIQGDSLDPQKFGRLYTWEAAKTACPEGWHLPSDTDWQEMIKLYGGDIGAFSALMEGGNTNFTAVLGGKRGPSGSLVEQNLNAYYWSNTEMDKDAAQFISFLSEFEVLTSSTTSKSWGYSCRCIADKE